MLRIALETGASVQTVRRWADHNTVSELSAYGLSAAARKLSIKRPAKKDRRTYKKNGKRR